MKYRLFFYTNTYKIKKYSLPLPPQTQNNKYHEKTLFTIIFSLLYIGNIASQTIVDTTSSVTNNTIKKDSTTTDTTEEEYIEYFYVEYMPEYPGGMTELNKYLKENM